MRLVRVVPLHDHLKAKAQRRVADLLLAQEVDLAIAVFARNRRLELLEAHEVLLIEAAEPIDGDLQLADQFVDLRLLHPGRLS
jgi:hypothetical protein